VTWIPLGATGDAARMMFRLVDDDTGDPITDKGDGGNPWNDTGGGTTDELYVYTEADGAFVEATILDIENLGRGFYSIKVDASVAGLAVVEHAVSGASPFSINTQVVGLSVVASSIWNAVMETATEGDVTFGDAMRGISSVLFGIVENFSTGTLAFKSLDGAKTRITGVRTAIGRISKVLNDLAA
jgi:hypothetical protein